MEWVICIWIFTINAGINGQIPNDNFLFGSTGSNVVWFQNGTKGWTESDQPYTTTAISFTTKILGVLGASYYHERKYLVFSDTGAKSIFLSGVTINRHVISYIGTSSSVGHVAVDWLSGNVYWCDGAFGWIGMVALPANVNQTSSESDKFKVVIDKYLDSPAGIAVQPSHGWIFWTDIGKQPKIERAALNGVERMVLVLHGIIRPVSITVDTAENNIYWTDPVRATIESCDFYGNNRRVLRTDWSSKYYGIVILKAFVYVSEQNKNQILVLSNTTGQELRTAYSPRGLNVSSISYYTAENQFVNNVACSAKGCQHICLNTNSDGVTVCTCRDGYTLNTDGKQCIAENKVLERSIVYVNNSRICSLPITYINIFNPLLISPDCSVGGTSIGTITHLDVNVDKDELYFNIDRTIYRQKLYQQATILYTATNTIAGLAYYWTTSELYWTVSGNNVIYHATLPADGSAQIISATPIITSLIKPTYIALNPIDRTLFAITEDNGNKQIQLVYLNNSVAVTLEKERLTNPNWLTYNRENDRLHWTDTRKLGSMTSSGQNVNIQEILGTVTLHGVTMFKDYLLWLQSSSESTSMYVNEVYSDEPQFSFPLNYLSSPSTFVIYDKNIQPQQNVPCVKDNGGCQQICVVYGVYAKCDCHLGYKLQQDEKSCKADSLAMEYFLTIDKLQNRLYRVYNRTEISAVDTGAIYPKAATVDRKSNIVIWLDYSETGGSSIKMIGINGESEATLTTDLLITSVAVDHSTGNIYYTTETQIKVFSFKSAAKRSLLSGLLQPKHITLHSEKGIMVWAEQNKGQPSIKRAFMDGTNVETVYSYKPGNITKPTGLAIDTLENRLIWSDSELDKIESTSLSNTGDSKQLLSKTNEHPVDVDVDTQYVYYIGKDQRSTRRIKKLDGTSTELVFSSINFGQLLSVEKVTLENVPVHALCKDNNGQCSSLCLPKGDNQRICQCADGVPIKDDGRTCHGDSQCPASFGDVEIDAQCTRYPGVTCDFKCSSGFAKNSSVNKPTCQQNGLWGTLSDSLCTRIVCPKHFINGHISDGCTGYVGLSCGVTCLPGYVSQIPTLICQENGQWNGDISTICKADTSTASEPQMSTGAIVGLVCGGIILLVIVVAVAVVCLLKRMRKESKKARNEWSVIYNANANNAYLTGTLENVSNNEIYDVIVEDKYTREKIQVATALSESSSSNRYSQWPQEQDPPPDYLEVVGAAGGHSPYLTPKSNDNYYSKSALEGARITPCSNKIVEDDYLTPQSSVRGQSGLEYNQFM